MALKKPSDFFGNNKKTPLDEVKESYDSARPEKIEQVSEAFDAFKSNLNHIQSLSDFTSTFDSFKENLEKVENVSTEIDSIKDEIKHLINKEDLDGAMMAQLLFVEESISKIESKISNINGKTVDKIREDFVNLSNSVESFLDLDVPKYKKLITESEVRFDDRLDVFKGQVEENLDSIKEDVSKEVTTALETVESVNENTINIVKAEFKETAGDFNKNVNELVEKELPKYKKLFAETELKTEETIKNAIDSYKETIESLNAKVKVFTETEIPKYNNLLIETKLKSEQEVKNLEQEVLSRVNNLTEKVQFISEGIPEKTSEKIQELKEVTDQYKEEIDSIAKKYQSLYKDFKNRETSEDKKLESYSKDIEKYQKRFNFLEETVSEDLKEIQNVLTESNETYQTNLDTEVSKLRDKISEQMRGLEVDLVTNEKHIKKQNENIENIQEELRVVLEKLQMSSIEEKNNSLLEKVNNIENILDTVNERTLLKEDNPTLPGDPSTNNSSDPLTPLDQKFVTLDQLQNHYRTFVNRIQQQIATIGGGGETRLRYLDDIVGIATNLSAYDGMYLGIDASNSTQPFVFSSVSGGGGTGAGGTWSNYDSNTGVTTTKKVKIQNNLEVTGVSTFAAVNATTGSFSGNVDVAGVLTYEDVTNIDSIGLITARSGIKVLDEGIHVVGVSTISTGVGTVHIGVGSTTLLVDGDARVTGILTIGSGSITLDPTAKKIEGIDEIIIGTGTTVRIHQDTSGEIAFSDREGKQASVGIGTTVSINTTGIITASQLAVSGLSTSKNLLVTGITSATNIIEIKSNDSTPGRIDLYCETNNAHYARLQAPEHGDFGGNITVKLPASTGTLLLSDGSGASLTALNASNLGSGTIPDARFPATLPAISGANLTGLPDGGVGIQSGSVRVGTGFTDIKITGVGITVVGSGTTVTVDIPSSTITRQSETSSGVTTDFTVTGGYTVGLLDVFVNGVKQINGSDFTATNGSTVTMTPNVTDGDIVEFQKYDKLNIAGIDKGIEIENNGTSVGTGITSINFSTNVTAVASGGIATITAAAGGGGDTVSINASAGDILSASSGEISADDAGSDKLVFWDDSESKLTYLTAGSGLSISGTTITASGGGGGSDGPSSVMMGMIF
ncbi:MAG: hypothetical protein CBC89_01600 [Euryarchaeota archaeon TMED129]|nr:MAG: hypothetical protein CBC89_01600 [Euryarchaeota archaeon TMED129]